MVNCKSCLPVLSCVHVQCMIGLNNSLWGIIKKFSRQHLIIRKAGKFENGYIVVHGWWMGWFNVSHILVCIVVRGIPVVTGRLCSFVSSVSGIGGFSECIARKSLNEWGFTGRCRDDTFVFCAVRWRLRKHTASTDWIEPAMHWQPSSLLPSQITGYKNFRAKWCVTMYVWWNTAYMKKE